VVHILCIVQFYPIYCFCSLSGALLTQRVAETSQMSATLSQLSEIISGGLTKIHRGQERHAHGMNKELDVMSDVCVMTKVSVCVKVK